MNVNFEYTDPAAVQPVVFEQVFAEKPGGGVVGNPTFDIPLGTAVGKNAGAVLTPIKAFRLVKAVAVEDTTIEIAKGSGVVVGDIIATAKKGVACTAVDTTTNTTKDVVTVTLGVVVAIDTVLYQAAAASASAAAPIYTPLYVTGDLVPAGLGDRMIRLVNGANLRKETANISTEVVALLPTINLV
jgi:hypothetical protein